MGGWALGTCQALGYRLSTCPPGKLQQVSVLGRLGETGGRAAPVAAPRQAGLAGSGRAHSAPAPCSPSWCPSGGPVPALRAARGWRSGALRPPHWGGRSHLRPRQASAGRGRWTEAGKEQGSRRELLLEQLPRPLPSAVSSVPRSRAARRVHWALVCRLPPLHSLLSLLC